MSKRYLPALIVLLLLVTAAAGLISTGADGRVPITRLNFDSAQHVPRIFAEEIVPVPHNYPEVVARVNGEVLAGDDLMERQVKLANDRAAFEQSMLNVGFSDEEIAPVLTHFDSADPLDLLIDEALLRQAVLREGTRISREEAQEWLRDNEAQFNNIFSDDPPEQRAEFDAMLIAIGYPLRDWAADDRIVEGVRMARGMSNLGELMCDSVPANYLERDPTRVGYGHDCSAFLASERAAADIVYFVRWAD